ESPPGATVCRGLITALALALAAASARGCAGSWWHLPLAFVGGVTLVALLSPRRLRAVWLLVVPALLAASAYGLMRTPHDADRAPGRAPTPFER
ncbi:MAG: hypothetical protein JWM10_3049, partial [Myxococcaceae bacterium]|nr:hypothetical protein [Myxococcaceae bacterium]